MSRPGGGPGGGASPGRGLAAGDPARRGGEGRRERARAQAAGHDRVVPVLPAAAGRAPLPRPLRYRPRVLTGGGQTPARLGAVQWGLGWRAARRASRPLFPGSGARPGPHEARAWPMTLVGGRLLTPVAVASGHS